MTLEEKIAMANQVRSRDRFGSVSPEEQAALPGTETELWIKTANGCKIHVFEERPDTLPPKAALLLNFHGGGFIKGRTDRDRRYCCTLMERLNCLVWDVDYCLAPEKAFPAAVHESYGIAEYAFDHAAELGVDPEKIILAGHSAGGNLVAAACIQMALPGGILTGIRFGAGQQGRAPVKGTARHRQHTAKGALMAIPGAGRDILPDKFFGNFHSHGYTSNGMI